MSATAPSDLIALHDEIKSHKRKAIIHYHLHKTGGTTIKRVFHENFKDSSIKVDSLAELGEFEKRFANGLFDEEKSTIEKGRLSYLD